MDNRDVERLALLGIAVLFLADRLLGLPAGAPLALWLALPVGTAAVALTAPRAERLVFLAVAALVAAEADERLLQRTLPRLALPALPLPEELLGVALAAGLLVALSSLLYRTRGIYQYSIERSANRDGLTGLYNQRFFQRQLDQMLAPSQRRKSVVSLLWVDIDNFKPYNDTFGHEAGDDLLRALAGHLSRPKGFRSTDYICRAGGDEFAIILPNTNSEEAEVVARRLRAYLDRFLAGKDGAAVLDRPVAAGGRSSLLPFKERAQRVRLGFSVGVATAVPGTTAAELRKWADERMYTEKEAHHSRSSGQGSPLG